MNLVVRVNRTIKSRVFQSFLAVNMLDLAVGMNQLHILLIRKVGESARSLDSLGHCNTPNVRPLAGLPDLTTDYVEPVLFVSNRDRQPGEVLWNVSFVNFLFKLADREV